jgi:hypothetical protein
MLSFASAISYSTGAIEKHKRTNANQRNIRMSDAHLQQEADSRVSGEFSFQGPSTRNAIAGGTGNADGTILEHPFEPVLSLACSPGIV